MALPDTFTDALARITNPAALSEYIATRKYALDNLFLAQILPPVRSTLADIRYGYFRVVTTPAPITAVDSPYDPVASIQAVDFNGTTFKIAGKALLSEAQQDAMHARAQANFMNGLNTQSVYEDFIMQLIEDGVSLSLDYGEEITRAAALATGKLNLTQGLNVHQADFGVPADYRYDRSTTAKGGYAGANSSFWNDVYAIRDKLFVEPEAITDPITATAILNNPVNKIVVLERLQISPTVVKYTLGRYAQVNGANSSLQDPEARARLTLWVYANRGDSTGPYFWPSGNVTFMRRDQRPTQLIDGQIVRGALGVTHIGPNTESGFQSTRFLKARVDDDRPFQVIALGAEDILPQIREPRNLVLVATTVV
ncbi:hypothetical protein Q0M94_28295 (plasmid) [Deinococcus radiomollis]|uniref:hypothetical protein n=1 Tax=Deinococcus radiomollis TaxID=468916 RepID=UPI0038928DD6